MSAREKREKGGQKICFTLQKKKKEKENHPLRGKRTFAHCGK